MRTLSCPLNFCLVWSRTLDILIFIIIRWQFLFWLGLCNKEIINGQNAISVIVDGMGSDEKGRSASDIYKPTMAWEKTIFSVKMELNPLLLTGNFKEIWKKHIF